jgi:eukaryotic-like serine/threonine-protein kinase
MSIERLSASLADRYRIERELGAGGMATVYLAHDLKHDRKVAIKVLRPELAAVIGAERFLREIKTIATLQHPHILGLIDSGEVNGTAFYVMPFVSGESLRERLNREMELPVGDVLRLLGEVADALALAHARGVIHRDIKPDNILLSGRHALVADFGIARAVNAAASPQKLTDTGLAIGTPAYMAPEQASGDHVDHRVDIYALGVMGYEMLTGEVPFRGNTAQEVIFAAMTRAPEPLTLRRPSVPAALDAVILKCLEKRAADRWPTAEDLRTQLEAVSVSSGDHPATPAAPPVVSPRRREVPRWLAWAIGGALVAAGAFALTLHQRSAPAISLGNRMAVAVAPVMETWPTLSPDGRTVAYTVSDAGSEQIMVQQVDGGAPVPVTAQLGYSGQQALSPDGSKMLFIGPDGLYLMPTLGGQARMLVPHPVGWGNWSPDGTRIVYTAVDTIFTQALDQPARTPVATGPALHSPVWSQDGVWIAFVQGNPTFHLNGNSASSMIRIVPASGGNSIAVTDSGSLNTSPIWVPGQRALLFISDREGGRDIYELYLRRNGFPQGSPARITTGLNPERVCLSADGRRLAWSVFTQTSNFWSIAIPAHDSMPLSRADQVTSGSQNIEEGVVSADGKWLYYTSDRSGNADIWRQSLSGGQPEQLTTDPAGDFAPDISPDGRDIAFHSLRNGPDNRDVFVMPAGGGTATQVSTSPGDDRTPHWSRDGGALVWGDNSSGRGILLSRRAHDGSWSPPLRFEGVGGRWTSDGRSLSYTDSLGFGLLDPETSTRTPVFGPGIVTPDYYAWSPDDHTVYMTNVDSLGRVRIMSVSVPGGKSKTLVYADNPLVQGYRYGFDVKHGNFYLPLLDRKSDVWVAEVVLR